MSDAATNESGPAAEPVTVHNHVSVTSGWLLGALLFVSVLGNVLLYASFRAWDAATGEGRTHVEGRVGAGAKVALIAVNGVITRDTARPVVKDFENAAADDDVRAVVMAVDSPGGTVSGSDYLYQAVRQYKESGKPLVVSMQGIATSGGYYVSMPADEILADRSCVTGSVGVIMSLLDFSALLDKIGVAPVTVKTGKFKDNGSPYRQPTDADRVQLARIVDGMFDQFIDVIVAHRSGKLADSDDAAAAKLRGLEAKVFLAEEALALGLIDAIGYQDDATDRAVALARLERDAVEVVRYRRPVGSVLNLLRLESQAPAAGLPAEAAKLLSLQTPGFYMLPPAFLPGVR